MRLQIRTRIQKAVLRASSLAVILGISVCGAQAFAASPAAEKVLDSTSRQIRSYLEQISDVRCTEHVTQLKLSHKGGTDYKAEATFDYLVLMDGSNDQLLLNESRLPQGHKGKIPQRISMLVSNGFADLFLILHPYYRNSFEFEGGQEQIIDGQKLMVFNFHHLPGTRTPVALSVRGREYPLELSGNAYIDPGTGMLARIEAVLGKDMQDVGLHSLKVQVTYAPVQLPGWNQTYRFPSEAIVEVESLKQHWRNIHQFSNYQRFTVDTQVSVAKNTPSEDQSKK